MFCLFVKKKKIFFFNFFFFKIFILVNILSISFFVDPLGYKGVVTNFQFQSSIATMCIIPFIVAFNAISLNFSYLLIRMSNYPSYFKILISVFTVSLSSLAILLFIVDSIKLCLYELGDDNLRLAGKIVAPIIYGFEILIFIARSVVIFLKIKSFDVSSDQDLQKKSQYKKLFFWVCFVTLGYLLTLAASIAYIPDSVITPKNLVAIFFFIYLGFAITSFGLIFILKPRKSSKSKSSSNNLTKDTNKLSTRVDN